MIVKTKTFCPNAAVFSLKYFSFPFEWETDTGHLLSAAARNGGIWCSNTDVMSWTLPHISNCYISCCSFIFIGDFQRWRLSVLQWCNFETLLPVEPQSLFASQTWWIKLDFYIPRNLVYRAESSTWPFGTTANMQLNRELQSMGLWYLLDFRLMCSDNKILPQMVHSFACFNIRNTYKIELKHNCIQFLKWHWKYIYHFFCWFPVQLKLDILSLHLYPSIKTCKVRWESMILHCWIII